MFEHNFIGFDDNPRAPWNDEERSPVNVDVTFSFCASRIDQISTNNYNEDTWGTPDYKSIDIEQEYFVNHLDPNELLKLTVKYLNDLRNNLKEFPKSKDTNIKIFEINTILEEWNGVVFDNYEFELE